MSKNSAVIKYGYVNHREYKNKIADNQKHSTVCRFFTNPFIVSERKGTTSAFVKHLQRFHKPK